jgi:nicotinate phosphoribosyltransferase
VSMPSAEAAGGGAGPPAIFTDLYEVTMAQAYWAEGMHGTAVFELFFRNLPPGRSYILAAGLDDVLAFLESFRLGAGELAYLRGLGLFGEDFLDSLEGLRFSGEVHAVAEGTPVFPGEPLLQVVAPLREAQWIETLAVNQIHFQSVIASKAARMVGAAKGRPLVDFGARRAHGTDAALKAARASYLAGAAGTSNVLAGMVYGIPVLGTMAHSYIQAHDDELAAMTAFARQYPRTTLLVDTYETLDGVRKVIELARRLGDRFEVRSIRLDSGDLAALARESRRLLDAAGLERVEIFASGGLDEHEISKLLDAGAPIDGFGVGTRLVVSEDAPALDMAYKLVEYEGRPRLKLSPRKALHPGRKQVFRSFARGEMVRDVIGLAGEELEGEPLLWPVMAGGRRLPEGRVTLEESRRRARAELERLPPALRSLEGGAGDYPVLISPGLDALGGELEAKVGGGRVGETPNGPPAGGSRGAER